MFFAEVNPRIALFCFQFLFALMLSVGLHELVPQLMTLDDISASRNPESMLAAQNAPVRTDCEVAVFFPLKKDAATWCSQHPCLDVTVGSKGKLSVDFDG